MRDADPYDVSIRLLVQHGTQVDCDGAPPMTFIQGQALFINTTALMLYYSNDLSHCRFQTIHRKSYKSDNEFYYSSPRSFTNTIPVPGEYMRVFCYNSNGGLIYTNYHTAVIRKPDVEQRCQKARTPDEALNILMIGVDSVSRLNFVRQFQKTRRFLLKELGATELRLYNIVAENTYVNLVPMFAGKFVHELPWDERTDYNKPFDEYGFLWKNFSSLGYRTLYTEDAPHIAIFNYGKEGFHTPPADYYSRPYSLALEEHGAMWNHGRDCVGTQLETERVLHYVKDFMHEFQNDPFFAFAFITRLTHDDLNKAGAADEPYFNFFKSSHDIGLFDNAVIFFFSDHGIRFGPVLETFHGRMEERLPFMYVALPPWVKRKYPNLLNRLHSNANKLTTPFDIYQTLGDLLDFDTNKISRKQSTRSRGMSLFSEIPASRSCSDAAISPHYCACRPWKVLPHNGKLSNEIAEYVVTKINSRLQPFADKCAYLELEKITDTRTLKFTDDAWYSPRLNNPLSEFMLTFQTRPGKALFEVTVHATVDLSNIQIIGDVNRINAYEGQADCMLVHTLRKFCLCE